MKQKVAVVIPVYREHLTPNEQLSIRQCVTLLSHYDIILLAPEGLDSKSYSAFYPKFKYVYFHKDFFTSTIAYSNLLLSTQFYTKFEKYQYILIHQTDAYLFRDELALWCEKGYDYIGAPWISEASRKKNAKHYQEATNSRYAIIRFLKRNLNFSKNKDFFVGNGGLSLRKVQSFKAISQKLSWIGVDFNRNSHNEDIIWAIYVPIFFPFFKVPAYTEAIAFSFEENPTLCHTLNSLRLPFGCHAWEKYEPDFWKQYIPF
jgi:hypothetical protein